MSIFRTSTSTRWRSARLSSACRLRNSVVSESDPPERWSHKSCGRLRRAVATISCSDTKFAAAFSSMRGYFRGFSFGFVPCGFFFAITFASSLVTRHPSPVTRHCLKRQSAFRADWPFETREALDTRRCGSAQELVVARRQRQVLQGGADRLEYDPALHGNGRFPGNELRERRLLFLRRRALLHRHLQVSRFFHRARRIHDHESR